MKAFLLAAGNGTRLRPLTEWIPKCLVPIRGVPLLQIWLEVCRRAGITEVLVNVHAHADSVRKWLMQADPGMPVHVIEESVLLGSAGTLLANQDWVAKESSFWVIYADVLTNADLMKMRDFHANHSSLVTMGTYRVENPTRCGIVTFDEEKLVRSFEEKPSRPKSNWAFSGLMIARPSMLAAIPQDIPSDLGFHVFPRLLGQISVYPIDEYLIDVGTTESYEVAQLTWPGLQEGQFNGH